MNQKIVLKGEYENIIDRDGHFFIEQKNDRICVIPYIISESGMLDKIGVVEYWNREEERNSMTLLNDYLNEDDTTNLVGANRILYDTLNINFSEAERWMYLGTLYNGISPDSPIRVYSIDISSLGIDKITLETPEGKKFKLLDVSRVLQSDDMLFLSGFVRLFNYFYTKSL